METRAPFVIVGAFVVAAIAAAFGFVYWLHNSAGIGARSSYHLQFDGPVPGLLVGASVLFNGIRVGEVTDLGLAPDIPRRVNATISVASTTPVRSDTKVGLEFQGLTGVPVVAGRSGGAPEAVRDGDTGVVVDGWDAGAIAASVSDLLADPDRAARMGKAGRRWVVDNWQWRTQAEKLAQLL